jgi:hypothetical protein
MKNTGLDFDCHRWRNTNVNMKRKRFSFGIAAGLTVLAIASAARAESIPIVNPSFEIPPVKEGIRTVGGIPGWTFSHSQPNAILEVGVFHPPVSGFPPVTPTDGLQVGYMHLGGSVDARISQLLGATVTAGMVYILRVDYLRTAPSTVDGGCAVGLETPNSPLALSDVGSVPPSQTLTATFTAPPGDAHIGEPLRIFIDCANFNPGEAFFFFDNVRLDAIHSLNSPVLHGAFGLIGLLPHETARLNAFCDGSVMPTPSAAATPCEATLEFHDINGRLLQHSELTLRPGTGGFLDQTPPPSGDRTAAQIIPSWRFTRGNAVASLELFDSSSLRTRLLIDWGDGAVARTGEADFGLAAITPFDNGHLGAFCPAAEGDGSVTPAPCDVMFEFHDSTGRMLKQSSMTLRPGTGGFLDLTWPDTGSTARRVEINPGLKVIRGAAVATFAIVDSTTGLTITQTYPVIPPPTGDRPEALR